MMGHSHAITGAVAWVAITAPAASPVHQGPWGVAAGALVCAGAALLSDLDHSGATISRALPPITNVLSAIIGAISGGHRKGTHSILGVAVFVALAWASALWTVTLNGTIYHPGPAIASVVLASLGLKAIGLGFNPALSWVLSLGAGAAVFFTLAPGDAGWFPVAVGVGVVAHIIGDILTTQGVPVLYPFSSVNVRVPILGNAGSMREHLLIGATVASLVLIPVLSGGTRPLLAL